MRASSEKRLRDDRLTQLLQIEIHGLTTIESYSGSRIKIASLGERLPDEFSKALEKGMQANAKVVELENSITAEKHLSLEEEAYGKVCMGYNPRTNTLHLYGFLWSSYLQELTEDARSVAESVENILKAVRSAQGKLDDSGIYHSSIPRPDAMDFDGCLVRPSTWWIFLRSSCRSPKVIIK